MPKLTETYASKIPFSKTGTTKLWDNEIKGLVLFVGKQSKTWYFQKDIGGQTKRILIGRFPIISAQSARQTAMGYALDWSRGAGKHAQRGAPTLEEALASYLLRPKLRSETHIEGLRLRQQFDLHLKEWLRLPLDDITKRMVVEKHSAMAATPSGANHLLKYLRTAHGRPPGVPHDGNRMVPRGAGRKNYRRSGCMAANDRCNSEPNSYDLLRVHFVHGIQKVRSLHFGVEKRPRRPHSHPGYEERAKL